MSKKRFCGKVCNGDEQECMECEESRKAMKIYVICPVRNITAEQAHEILQYVHKLEKEGHKVFYPRRDAPQDSRTGFRLVMKEREAIKDCDRVDIFWDVRSSGSHCDLGMAMAYDKPLKLIKAYQDIPDGKAYIKVIMEIERCLK